MTPNKFVNENTRTGTSIYELCWRLAVGNLRSRYFHLANFKLMVSASLLPPTLLLLLLLALLLGRRVCVGRCVYKCMCVGRVGKIFRNEKSSYCALGASPFNTVSTCGQTAQQLTINKRSLAALTSRKFNFS